MDLFLFWRELVVVKVRDSGLNVLLPILVSTLVSNVCQPASAVNRLFFGRGGAVVYHIELLEHRHAVTGKLPVRDNTTVEGVCWSLCCEGEETSFAVLFRSWSGSFTQTLVILLFFRSWSGSFTETLSGWAEAVVTGRARLGGIPVGVIATEGRLREKNCPADPADVSSHERIVQQVCVVIVIVDRANRLTNQKTSVLVRLKEEDASKG